MKLIVGLGNPGEQYAQTRHNIGFLVLDELARRWGISLGRNRFQAVTGEGNLGGEKLLLAKPQTYMNRSGTTVAQAMDFYRLSPADLLLVHDDKDLDFGRMKIRVGGSDGGHKGIRSILSHVHTPEFCRCRLGVGRPEHGEDTSDFVLSKFYSYQIRQLAGWVDTCADAVESVLRDGPERAANAFNNRLWVDAETGS